MRVFWAKLDDYRSRTAGCLFLGPFFAGPAKNYSHIKGKSRLLLRVGLHKLVLPASQLCILNF